MTALSDHSVEYLETFDKGYDEMMAHWEQAINHCLAHNPSLNPATSN